MNVTCEVKDRSLNPKDNIIVTNDSISAGQVIVRIGSEYRTVIGKELISAIERAEIGILGW